MLYLQWLIVVVLTLFPIVVFIVPKGANTTFYLLLLVSLVAAACRCKPMGKSLGETFRRYWPINLAMAGLVCAILLNQLSIGDFSFKTYDMPSRLACFTLMFWIFLLAPGKAMKHIEWGLVVGSIICAVALYIGTAAGNERPLRLFDIPLVPFGNIAMLMGTLALFSIGWNKRDEQIAIALKVVAGALAAYGSYLSKTRGGWAAVPLFILIGIAFLIDVRLRHKLMFFLIGAILLFSFYVSGSAIQERIDEGISDVSHYLDGKDQNTAVGIRIQLWRGSWLLFTENPVFGTGPQRFPHSLQQLVARHEVTPEAATHLHSHNEILFQLATLGIWGLLAILSLYFIPAFYFLKEVRNPDRETRTVAAMGLALCLGFFVFGLTDVMFYWSVSHTFYVIVLAALFAHLVRRQTLLDKH